MTDHEGWTPSADVTEDWEQSVRNARAILDPDEPPRALFVGLFHTNGTDWSFGINHDVVDADNETAQRASLEVLAAHVQVLAEEYDTDPEALAERVVEIAGESVGPQ